MAEIAIPIVFLGAMYILSNTEHENYKKEAYENMNNTKKLKIQSITNGESLVNYPVEFYGIINK